jgi:hypothetical protein
MATSDVELIRLPGEDAVPRVRQLDEQNFGPADGVSSIPPADRGKAAYLFLVACFVCLAERR